MGAAGAEHVYELTVACGRPPAKERVVAIRRATNYPIGIDVYGNLSTQGRLKTIRRRKTQSYILAVEDMALESEKLIFWPSLTLLNIAMGHEEAEVLATVPGDQLDILSSVLAEAIYILL